MTDSIDLEAIDRGLGALLGMLGSPDVRAALAVFRADFLAASKQISVLSDYKDLHDLFHELQFGCYNDIEEQASRFPEAADAIEVLEDHKLTFGEIIGRMQEVMNKPTISGAGIWVGKLAKSEVLLQGALDDRDPVALAECCGIIKRVLSVYPTSINTALKTAAKAMRMDAVEQALADILAVLKARGFSPSHLENLEVGYDSLTKLNRRLTCLVQDHDGWQALDVDMSELEDSLHRDPARLAESWPDVKRSAASLLCSASASAIASLQHGSDNLDRALARQDSVQARDSFKRYHHRAANQFFLVDKELKELCGQLRILGSPLAALGQFVPISDGDTFSHGDPPWDIQCGYWQRQLDELTGSYDGLTRRLAALSKDIRRETDSEHRLVLRERGHELELEREQIVERQTDIESKLRQWCRPEEPVPSANSEVTDEHDAR